MNYKTLHDNGQEYGPISADTLRQWIRDGRVNVQTRVQPDGSTEWTTLGALAEFRSDLAPAGKPKTSGLAIASLVLGIMGLVSCGLTSLFGLVLGIVGLVKINKSQGRLSGNGLAIAGIVTSCLFILLIPIQAAMLLPALSKAKAKAQCISCVNNMKQMGLAVRIYSMDNDDNYPTEKWCDLMLSELGSTNVLVCPAHDGSSCGYAYNSNLIGREEGSFQPDTVIFFESDAGWNAVGGPELMIQQSRHSDVFNVGFADGSVHQLPATDLPSLRWDP